MSLPPVFLPYFRHLQCPNMTEGTEQEGPQLAGLGGARVALQGEEGVLGRPGWKGEGIFSVVDFSNRHAEMAGCSIPSWGIYIFGKDHITM